MVNRVTAELCKCTASFVSHNARLLKLLLAKLLAGFKLVVCVISCGGENTSPSSHWDNLYNGLFILSLNIYCIVCVVSQYQEYKAGRGTAIDDLRNCRTPPVKYLAKSGSVATVALTGRRAGTAGGRNCDVDEEMSPQGESTEKTEEVPSVPGAPKLGGNKKQVKFGDNEEFHIQYSIISKGEHSDGNGAAIIAGVDSEPLIQKRDDSN
ncbi:uncharacterized protein LOC111051226 [Nilaparvata lugens]|uniref:uncharacterized protein LOC111051226 n=1 Tax=Nilaparvata lugens TaxID=108931 RepID=UPI00193E6807|nr:uncharacterized protein LOC111051226 [Nilaparvata lugens]